MDYKKKLKGQRLGQALWNAMIVKYPKSEQLQTYHELVAHKLFYIEDEELRKLLNDYLREL